MFKYYGDNILNDRECYRNPSSIFYLFYFNYIKYTEKGYANCYKFTNILSNELYYIILFAFILYLVFRFKPKFFDKIIILLFIVNVSLSFLCYYDALFDKMTMEFIFSQTYSEKFTHLMINYFFIGFFIGICYFYYNDAVSADSYAQSEKDLSFNMCFKVIKFIDSLKSKTKIIITIVLLLLQMLISFHYTIFLNAKGINDYYIRTYDHIFDMYSKIIYSLIFGLIFLLLITFPKDGTLHFILQTNVFVMFNRISICFFSLKNLIIYIIYCVFHFELKLSYQNLFFISLGLMFFIVLVSIILEITIEITIRKLLKKIMKKEKAKLQKKIPKPKIIMLLLKKSNYKQNEVF